MNGRLVGCSSRVHRCYGLTHARQALNAVQRASGVSSVVWEADFERLPRGLPGERVGGIPVARGVPPDGRRHVPAAAIRGGRRRDRASSSARASSSPPNSSIAAATVSGATPLPDRAARTDRSPARRLPKACSATGRAKARHRRGPPRSRRSRTSTTSASASNPAPEEPPLQLPAAARSHRQQPEGPLVAALRGCAGPSSSAADRRTGPAPSRQLVAVLAQVFAFGAGGSVLGRGRHRARSRSGSPRPPRRSR